jgi:hypothetical protein
MTDIAAMVKELIEAGADPAAAAEIVAKAFVAGATKARPRKSPNDATYTPDFDEWWLSYPRSPNMSKKEAYAQWLKLQPAQRDAAKAGLPAYKTWLASRPDHPVVHACRYLSQRRFEGFAAQYVSGDTGVFVSREDPMWPSLARRYWQEKGRPGPPVDRDGGWRFPSHWLNGGH